MSENIDTNKYKDVCLEINRLINAELDNPKDIASYYPKLVIMYEFFRLLRGEAFNDLRQPDLEFQKELYAMEDGIFNKIKELKAKIPENNSEAKFNFENIISLGLRL